LTTVADTSLRSPTKVGSRAASSATTPKCPGERRTLVGFDEIPDWGYTFSVPDDFDLDNATPAELRAAYLAWQARVQEWRDTHGTPRTAELLDDPVAMADQPWDPATDPP
jgi:hypothetical protein